jgi:hypothetical protein
MNRNSQNILIILLHSSITSLMKDTTTGKICTAGSRAAESHEYLQSHWRATSGYSTLESGIWNGGQKRFWERERDTPKYTILKFRRLAAATKKGTLLLLVCIFARFYCQLERSANPLIFCVVWIILTQKYLELSLLSVSCLAWVAAVWCGYMTSMFGSMAYHCHYNIS